MMTKRKVISDGGYDMKTASQYDKIDTQCGPRVTISDDYDNMMAISWWYW